MKCSYLNIEMVRCFYPSFDTLLNGLPSEGVVLANANLHHGIPSLLSGVFYTETECWLILTEGRVFVKVVTCPRINPAAAGRLVQK